MTRWLVQSINQSINQYQFEEKNFLHLVMTGWLVYTLVILQAGLALESLATIGTLQLLRAEIINLRSSTTVI